MFNYANQKPSHEYSVYFGTTMGRIAVYADGIVLKTGRKDIPVRSNYVESVSREQGEALLGKIVVDINYFDMFGNRESCQVKMRENDYLALKKDLGK